MVMIPPDVVRTRASSTVLENASSLVNRDFAGISLIVELGRKGPCLMESETGGLLEMA